MLGQQGLRIIGAGNLPAFRRGEDPFGLQDIVDQSAGLVVDGHGLPHLLGAAVLIGIDILLVDGALQQQAAGGGYRALFERGIAIPRVEIEGRLYLRAAGRQVGGRQTVG